MSFTRFYYDPCRAMKSNQQSTDPGRWVLDVPGNGDKPCFPLDPQIIPQKWGGNLRTNSINLESQLLGLDRRICRDNVKPECSKRFHVDSKPIHYPLCKEFLTTEQSRAIMPAWTARDLVQNDAYYLPNNPQVHALRPFTHLVSTRILEKNNYKSQTNIPSNNQVYTLPIHEEKEHYVGGPNTCSPEFSCGVIH
jgi:hypothetical protein